MLGLQAEQQYTLCAAMKLHALTCNIVLHCSSVLHCTKHVNILSNCMFECTVELECYVLFVPANLRYFRQWMRKLHPTCQRKDPTR